ncbi:MAG: hypothetical protein GY884_09245 [Proteobacteria bacterium]|nr:hypothetical protein [Pseudomonadota bacterium]
MWLSLFLFGCPEPPERGPTELTGEAPLIEQCDAIEVDGTWTLRHAGERSDGVAALVAEGSLLLGCEDELPELARSAGLRDTGLQLAVLDELDDVEVRRLETVYGVDLDLSEQAFAIGWRPGSVLIVGGSQPGLVFGVTSWLQSLDGIEQAQDIWAPDPRAPFPHTCSTYEASCGTDAACWDDGWTRPKRVAWCPQTVHDAPDVDVRMAFAAFKGTLNAHFIPNLVHAELGTCDDPLDTEPFWDATLGCQPGVEACNQVRVRLDTLVAGRFTHALDEGYPTAVADSTQDQTGCSGQVLYADIDGYLADRGVDLVPTVFGLETRVGDNPVGGPVIPQELPAELWGVDGDASLSEGLWIDEREMSICPLDGGGAVLAADCDLLDENGLSAPIAATVEWDAGATPFPTALADCDDFEICMVRGCWDIDTSAGDPMLTPRGGECTNPILRLYLPVDDERAGRWHVMRFTAIVTDTADLRVKLVTKDTEGITNTQDVTPIETFPLGDYIESAPTVRSLADEVVFSFVFRVPDDERISDAYIQLLGVPGSETFVDDLQVFELDGQLPAIDPSSLVVDGLDASCWSVDVGWTAPLPVRSYFDQGRELGLPIARIDVDMACAGDAIDSPKASYRSFTHSGLWPGVSTRQAHATFAPGVLQRRYWEHATAPEAQLRALGGAQSDFISISDLGGELRGMGRAELAPDEVLSSFVCGVREAACDVYGDCTSPPACVDGFDQGEGCSCTDTSSPTRLLLSSDMLTPWHNGGDAGVAVREAYQVPHGGPVGGTWTARRDLPAGTAVFSWWHYDARRVGGDAISTETLVGFVRDLTSDGLGVIGASAWDPDNQRVWAAMAAGNGTTHDLDVPGVAQFGWGTDETASDVMLQAGRVFWHPEWSFVTDWPISDSVELPGGSDLARWSLDGDADLQDSTPSWPQVGRSLLLGGDVVWSTEPAELAYRTVESDVLFRAHLDVPDGCTMGATVEADGVEVVATPVPGLADQTDIWSVWATVPAETQVVALALQLDGCTDGVLDDVALFQSLPGSDFPYPLVEKGLEDWTSENSADPRYKICGDGTVWDCKTHRTFVDPR